MLPDRPITIVDERRKPRAVLQRALGARPPPAKEDRSPRGGGPEAPPTPQGGPPWQETPSSAPLHGTAKTRSREVRPEARQGLRHEGLPPPAFEGGRNLPGAASGLLSQLRREGRARRCPTLVPSGSPSQAYSAPVRCGNGPLPLLPSPGPWMPCFADFRCSGSSFQPGRASGVGAGSQSEQGIGAFKWQQGCSFFQDRLWHALPRRFGSDHAGSDRTLWRYQAVESDCGAQEPGGLSIRTKPAGRLLVCSKWLWTFVTAKATAYVIRPSRSFEVAEEVLGADYSGAMVHINHSYKVN